jgi:hypothetical protein
MTGLLKSDIFFVVTTFAVVFVSVALVVVLIYIIRILKDMKILSRKVKDEGEKVLDDVAEFRRDAKVRGKFLTGLFSFFGFSKKKKDSEK